jgi:hypothetical protein
MRNDDDDIAGYTQPFDAARKKLETHAGAPPKYNARHFYRIPQPWLDAAIRATDGRHGELVVALVLYRRWLMSSRTKAITFGNSRLLDLGVSHDTKTRALKTLRRAKLITVKWRPQSSPLVLVKD